MLNRLFPLMAAVLILAACGCSSDSGSAGRATASPSTAAGAAPATPAATASGNVTVHQTARFEIFLPAGWRELTLSKEQIQAVAREVGGANPGLARLLNGLVDTEQYKQLQFYAYDPRGTDNVNVLDTPINAGATSQQVLDQVRPALPQIFPGATAKSGRAGLTINGLDAAELQYDVAVKLPDGSSQMLQGVQFYIIGGTTVHVITVTGAPRASFASLAEQIGTSFKLK